MCRIFGFRSVLFSKVHSSLVSAENALMGQSKRHPDGWGLAFYIAGTPHLIKSTCAAETDDLFKNVSGVVTSQTVIAHIRKATQGQLTILNTHPFQFGKWTFAHNGNIKNFEKIKDILLTKINPEIKSYRFGDTDSELIFLFILSKFLEKFDLHSKNPPFDEVINQLTLALTELNQLIGTLNINDKGLSTENYLTFVISNGPIMIALNGGMPLFYSTHKKKCPERDTCKSFLPICENYAHEGNQINHLIFSSEPLQGENVWVPLTPGQLVGIDENMRLKIKNLPLIFQ
jgi:predicted glutamine amidotransferase